LPGIGCRPNEANGTEDDETSLPAKEKDRSMDMKKEDVLEIAEGLKLIEEGVERIQSVMKERKIRSIQDMAAQLLPIFKSDDDSLSEAVLKHLG
jgi:hypothetical protein